MESSVKRIPYTKPSHKPYTKIEASFLPHASEHQCEVTAPNESPRIIKSRVMYQFADKADREWFQRQVRVRQHLKMIQALKICTSKQKNWAVDVHLKIWARDGQDMEPTFSFACMGKDETNLYHVEYKIRWFHKAPEWKEGKEKKEYKRLILYPYSEDTDLSYGFSTDDLNKKSQPLKDKIKRRVSFGSSPPLYSRSPPIGHSTAVLYDLKGETAPDEVKRLGYLDIEFRNKER
jgi:hypothetical protein